MNRQLCLVAVLAVLVLIGGTATGASYTTIVVVDHVGPDLQWFADMLVAYDADNPFSHFYGLLVADPDNMTFEMADMRPPGHPSPRTVGTVDILADALTAGPSIDGAAIDGLLGVRMAFEMTAEYLTDTLGTCVILLTNDAYTTWDPTADTASIEAAMAAREAIMGRTALNAIIDHGFNDGTAPAMGIRGETSRVADGGGGYMFGPAGLGDDRAGVSAYVEFARSHGSAWDLQAAMAAGPDQDSFRKAFRDVKVSEFGGVPHIRPPWYVPEPGTWILMVAGAGLLFWRRRRA